MLHNRYTRLAQLQTVIGTVLSAIIFASVVALVFVLA